MAQYQRGERINDIHSLMVLYQMNAPVYMRDKLQNWSWLQNMNLRTIRVFLDAGAFHFADRIGREVASCETGQE